jgi:predicted aldo/keto reductase-like oxidoreductase
VSDAIRYGRREFLRRGAVALLGAGALGATPSAPPVEPPRVRSYRTLGRTGLRVSDISFGSSRTTDAGLVRYALDRGVNYFDTAEGYRGGRSEEAIGAALAGERQRVFLASKTEAAANGRAAEFMAALEGSLRRLRTDYLDVYFNHAVNEPERMRNPEWSEFTARAREQGKIRWRGMSGHGGRLVECLDFALDHDQVDVVLVAYNFGQDPAFYERFTRSFDFVAIQPDLPRVLAKARQKGVGVVAMKTLMGARLNDLRAHERPGGTFAQAAFRWVLAGPHVDALVISMTSPAQVDEYLGASGAGAPGDAELGLLERYWERNAASYCRHGCDACVASCPFGVAIPDVLRARMYGADYGDLPLARETYAALGAGAAACAGCVATPCLAACPHGLDVAALARAAHQRLAV